MFVRTCERCQQSFEAAVANKRFCGPTCFAEHRKEYGAKNIESRKVERTCKQCGKTYRRVYEKSGFCTISCGAKWNIEHGVFDAWVGSQRGRRSGKNVPCNECGRSLYVVAHQFSQELHFCNLKCKGKYFGRRFTGSGNPMFGRKNSEEALVKSRRTLLQNHGVTNAFFLSKHRTVSKAQQEILDHLSSSVPVAQFEGEKMFHSGTHKYFIDIFSDQAKMIVEFNGDYWHCNPSTYSGSFFHPRKKKYAEQIWAEDAERMKVMRQKGYLPITVWESEYCSDKQGVLKRLTETALSCSRNNASG